MKETSTENQDVILHPEVKDSQSPSFYVIWTVVFGVVLGVGGSILESVQINPLYKVFLSGPLVVTMITSNKLILLRRYSVTHMYIIVAIISIFTNYGGPPGPLKILFILGGLSFDVGTLLKTHNIRYINLVIGHLCATITGFALSFFFLSVISLDLAMSLKDVFLIACAIYTAMIFPVSFLIWKTVNTDPPPEIVRKIRATLDDNDEIE